MSEYRKMMRRKLLEEMYDKMSFEEKRLFAQLTIQEKSSEEIKQALAGISKQVEDSRHSWVQDLSANIAGNAIFDGLVWIGSRLFRGIKL